MPSQAWQMNSSKRPDTPFFLLLSGLFCFLSGLQSATAQTDWPYVGGDAGGMRYSTLNQINRTNIKDLKPAWVFHTPGHDSPPVNSTRFAIECTPIVIDGVMYVTSADTEVIALDAATGRELWRFDPQRPAANSHLPNRGVAYWSDGRRGGARRICLRSRMESSSRSMRAQASSII